MWTLTPASLKRFYNQEVPPECANAHRETQAQLYGALISSVCVCVCFFLIHLRVDPRNLALLCLASSQVVHDGDLETPTEQEATGWTGLDPTRRLPLDGLRRDSVHRKTKRQIMTVCIVFYPMLQPLLEEFLLACLVALHTVTAQVCGAHV